MEEPSGISDISPKVTSFVPLLNTGGTVFACSSLYYVSQILRFLQIEGLWQLSIK